MGSRLWANWARPYFKTQMSTDRKTQIIADKKGQAILELAVFGSILIMLLGVLVNYGLRYNFQQQAMQQAFRRALGIAADPNRGSAAYVLIKDRHIPDPAHPFTVGTFVPVSSSASVTRDYQMHYTADTEEELPVVHIDINGDIRTYKTAGFNDEGEVDYSEGEILDYDLCRANCKKSGGAEWYCEKLDVLFPEKRKMGLQQDYTQEVTINSTMRKQEATADITTTDTIDWQNTTTRRIVYRPYGDTSGNTVEEEVISSVSQNRTQQWQTNW